MQLRQIDEIQNTCGFRASTATASGSKEVHRIPFAQDPPNLLMMEAFDDTIPNANVVNYFVPTKFVNVIP